MGTSDFRLKAEATDIVQPTYLAPSTLVTSGFSRKIGIAMPIQLMRAR